MNLSPEKQTEFFIQVIHEMLQEQQDFIRLELDLSHAPSLFESKFGGTGYVPHDGAIPVNAKNQQLRLLAQIECGKIPLKDFPAKGLLQFWVYDDDLSGADFDHPTVQNGFRILCPFRRTSRSFRWKRKLP